MDRTLWVWQSLPKVVEENPDKSWIKEGDAVENAQRLAMGGHPPGSFTSIVSGARFPQTVQHDLDLLDQFSKLARPGSRITIVQAIGTGRLFDKARLTSAIKLAGLVGVEEPKDVFVSEDEKNEIAETLNVNPDFQLVEIHCMVPNFANGSSAKLSFASKIQKPAEKKVWNLMDSDNEEDEDLINENDLLDEEDMAKPDQASLRVCGTTGKRKACKDCSCGLAEELSEGKEPQKKSFTSSCGSCYLGDAFRCASCPYLGMPAFKPGEKIQLSERQLKADQ
eukprot:11097.XXX_646250_647293_1 [CDS] Oithona nana genome sequencing.